jgi:hypothetical protein
MFDYHGEMAAATNDDERETETATEARLLVALRDIDKAVDAANDALTFTADAPTLGTALCDAVSLRNKVEALLAALAGAAERAGVPQRGGVRTVGQYLAARTGAEPRAVNADARRARWLRDYPTFAAAFAAGELSSAHVDHMRRNLDSHLARTSLRHAQQLLADAARDCSFADFVKVCDYWLITIDPDGKEPQDQIDRTSLSLRIGPGGRLILKGEADAVTGQVIRTAVEREAEKLRRQDAENGLTRSFSQRKLAALANLVARGAARSDGTQPVPLINIVMSLAVAAWAKANRDHPSGEPVPVDAFDVDGRCELIDGTPVHPALVYAMLGLIDIAHPTFRRYILDIDSRVLDVSVNARNFTAWQRDAALVQCRGRCETHGCDADFHSLQIDHVDPRHNGGATRFGNAQAQCRPDNYAKANTTGRTPWRDKSPPRRQRPPNSQHRDNTDNDPDD